MSFSSRRTAVKKRPVLDCSGDPGRTQQSDKDSCDIRNIMLKQQRTGLLTHINRYQGAYMDMSNSVDFQTAQNILASARSMFETVPATIRAMFHNDPGEFVDFMQDPANRDQILEIGLTVDHLPEPDPAPAGESPAPAGSSASPSKGAPDKAEPDGGA